VRSPLRWARNGRRSSALIGARRESFRAFTLALPRPLETFFLEMGRFVLMLWRCLVWTVRPPYDWRELLRQMVRVGVDSVPVVMLTALFTGMVMALQIFNVLERFNAESYVGSIVGLSMVRELAAVLSALILAGRAGSAMAAELGTMRVTEQIDALEVMATDPIHFLVVPRVWAAVITLPLLVVMADAVGIYGGYLVSVVLSGANPFTYVDNTFQFMDLNDFLSGIVKAAVFGLLVAVVGALAAGVFDAEPASLAAANEGGNVQAIGRILFTRYTFAFEIAGILLVVAAVGALVLGKRQP